MHALHLMIKGVVYANLFVAGLPCPDIPTVANSRQRYDETSSGIFISFVCDFAHHFPDRSTEKKIQCLLDAGRWDTTLTDCQGNGLRECMVELYGDRNINNLYCIDMKPIPMAALKLCMVWLRSHFVGDV